MDNEKSLQYFLDEFSKYDDTLKDYANNILILSKQCTEEYNKNSKIHQETRNMAVKMICGIVKKTLLHVYSELDLLTKIKMNVGIKALELLINSKEDTSDDNTNIIIDLSCAFIEWISSKYPVVGPIIGPLFGKAAKMYFNSVEEEVEIFHSYVDTFDYYYEYLLESRTLPEASQGQTTQLGGGVILIPNFQGVKSISGTYNNDSIENNFNSTYIYGLAGNDLIRNLSKNVTIYAGNGEDTISNTSNSSNSSIIGGAGNDSIINSADDVTIDGGNDNDYIENYFVTKKVSINGSAGNDTINNMYTLMNTLIGGEGNDLIENWNGINSYIYGGEGNDTITNKINCSNVIILGGAGNDLIENWRDQNFDIYISGNEGNDTINNDANGVTINGGTGDDFIVLNSGAINNLLLYEANNGNDIIRGFKINTTLKIGNGEDTYSKAIYGQDVIITVGNGKITLAGAKNLSSINIQGREISVPKWTLINTTAIYGTSQETFITLSGVKSLDGINLNNKIISLSTNALGTEKITVSNGYFLTLGNDVIKSQTNASGWTVDNTNATYKNVSISAGYKLDNNQITYEQARGGETLFSLSNIKNTDSIVVDTSKKTVTLNANNLTGKNVSISGDYSLALSGVNPSTSTNAHFDGLTYKSASCSEGYSLSNDKKSISYIPAVAETDLFSISGVTSAEGFDVTKNGSTYLVKITDAALNSATGEIISLVNKNSDAKFIFADDFSGKKEQTVEKKASLLNGKYSSTSYFKWFDLNEDTLTIHPAISAKTFSLNGLSSTTKLGENVIVDEGDSTAFTFKAAALDKKSIVITSNHDFSVALDDDVDQTAETIPESITLTNNILNYTSAGKGEYYSATNSGVSYIPPTARDTFSLSGLKKSLQATNNKIDGVSISDKTVTVDESALDMSATTPYTLKLSGDNFSLNLTSNKDNSKIPATLIAADNGVHVYTSEYTHAHFVGSDKAYTFTPATTPTIFTISGLVNGAKLDENVTVNGNTIKIKSGALSATHEAINVDDDNYTVELAQDVAKVEEIKFAAENGKVTLSGTTAGYAKVGDSYEWQEQVGGEELTITGLKNGSALTENMFSRSGNVITFKPTQELLPDNLVAQSTISIIGGVIDTSSLTKTDAEPAQWKGATRFSAKTASSWTNNAATVTYTAATGGEEIFTVSGLNGTPNNSNISVGDKKITILDAALLKDGTSISATNGYVVELSASLEPKDPINKGWDGTNYYATDGYKTAGWSLINGEVSKVNVLTPAVTVSGVKSNSGLSVNGKTVIVSSSSLNKKTVTISGNGYSLKLADDVVAPVETKAGWSKVSSSKAIYNFDSTTAGYTLADNKVRYTKATEAKSFTLSGIKSTGGIKVDGSSITITAVNLNKKAVTISDGYTLKLGNDVSTSTTKTAGSFTKFKSGTATFKTTSYSDFYSLKNNKVTYTAPSGGKTISIKNLKSSATLDEIKSSITVAELKNGTFKITFKNADVLITKAPTISASGITYTVALDKSLKPASLAPDWKVSGSNASLKSDTSAGYTVSDNKIIYNKKVTGSPQLVLGGLIKNSSLSAPVKKVVTLDTKVLGSNSSLKSNDGSYTVKLTGNMSKKTFTSSVNADTLNIVADNAAVLGGAGNDSFTVSSSKVTLTGGKGNDSFKLSGKNPTLIYNTGDGNDTVNFVVGMQISLSGSTQIKTLGKSGSDLLLGFGKNSSLKVTRAKSTDTIKVSDTGGSVTLVAGKFDLANSLTFNSKNSSVTVDKNFMGSLAPSDDIYLGNFKLSGVATINASNVTSEISISSNDKANFIFGGKNNDEIFGGNGNDSIVGNAGNDKLFGQNGNDSLVGGKGNDSLWGGDGKDVFIYSAGKDVIADFTAGQDKIQIASGKISKTSLSDSDVLFTIGKGSLTVKNAKGKTISLLDSSGKASSTVVGAQTLTNSNKASVTIGADMGAVDASARTKAISITGNALANSICGGSKNDSIFGAAGNDSIIGNAGNDKLYGDAGNDILLGGKGNDSLWGGAGNDSLWGDAGNDTFIYTVNEGTDKIFDYADGDILKILNADGSDGYFKSSKYSGGDLTLTINGGGKIIFDDVASTTKFNINGLSYNISGSKLVKK